MAKKAIDLDQIQKLTERGRQRAERRESKKRLSEDQKNDAQAKKLSDDVIAGLPERIKKEARKGSDSLIVNLPSGWKLHNRVRGNISRWCFANKIAVKDDKVAYSDDCTEEVLVISWPKKGK